MMWTTKEAQDSIEKFFRSEERYQLFFWTPEHDKLRKERKANKRDLKFAYIFVGNTHIMCMIDMNTGNAYKLEDDDYEATWMEIKKFRFDRWCRPMDL